MSRAPVPFDLFARTLRMRHLGMTRSFRPLAAALLIGLALASCAKKAAEGERTMSPEEGAAFDSTSDLDVLEAQLAAREDQLRALGAAPPGGAATQAAAPSRDLSAGEAGADVSEAKAGPQVAPTAAAAEKPAERSNQPVRTNRCENVCDLSAAICQLQDQICGLVPRHEGEPRYQRACDRASADCSFATEACHACA